MKPNYPFSGILTLTACIFLSTIFPSKMVRSQSIGVIGTATYIGDWVSDVDMNQDPGNTDLWTLQMTLSVGEVKFRQDNSWTYNWGGNDFPAGTAVPNGPNIPIASGNYLVSFNANTLAYSFDILSEGNTGLGTFHPQERLDVNGNVRFSGELMPDGVSGSAGQVLQSDGDGKMQWADRTDMQGSVGYGPWGDCEMNNITEYFPISDTNGGTNYYYGKAVAISNGYAAVGSPEDDGPGSDQGSVSIYKYDVASGYWIMDGQKLFNRGAQDGDNFGFSVSMAFPYLIVGADKDDSVSATDQGSVSIYKRDEISGLWEVQGEKLLNPSANSARFGYSVDISGEFAIVGAPNDLAYLGSATIFKRNDTTGIWEQDGAKLVDPSPTTMSLFGCSVGISGDHAIIGAPYDDGAGTDRGSVCFYKRDNGIGEWNLAGSKVFNQDAADGDSFGSSVDISDGYAIVGAPTDDEGGGNDQGTASIFKLNETTEIWEMQFPKMTNLDADADEYFGVSVSISGDYALIGASYEDGQSGVDQGTAMLVRRIGNFWQRYQKISDPGSWGDETFGCSVSLDNTAHTFLIGAKKAWGNRGKVVFGKY